MREPSVLASERLHMYSLRHLLTLMFCFTVLACGPAFSDELKCICKKDVFFVTDRQMTQTPQGVVFSNDRSPTLSYGMCVPNATGDASAIKVFSSKDEFLKQLAQDGHKVSIFIHGYRKNFDGAVEVARAIAVHSDDPVVLFAWPSKNKYSAYMIDECTAEWSSHHLADVMESIGKQVGNQNVTLMSHSLAARMICWSMGILAQRNELQQPFKSVVFFSPDMDRDTFLADAPLIKRGCSYVKIYIDSHDSRLWLSKVLHGSPRLGTVENDGEQPQIFQVADFDNSMECHRITLPLLHAALGCKPEAITTAAMVAH